MFDEYRALVQKVDAFVAQAFTRRARDMACKQGCSACCHVSLTVSVVEARQLAEAIAELAPAQRTALAERGRAALAREAMASEDAQGQPAHANVAPRCVMLDGNDACMVYAHRPLVCRSQGHALRYPPGFVPIETVRARAGHGDVVHCPLNFVHDPPRSEDVLDAELVDRMLALVNHRFALARSEQPALRTSLSTLAARADVLASPGLDDGNLPGDPRQDDAGDGRAP